MNDTEGLQLDPANLSEITINGTMVPMFKQFGKQWYQLITLLRALEFPETGFGGLPTKIGNQFWDSGEFLKYKDIWYGTAKGLSLYAEDLQTYQYSPTGSPKDKHTARVRQTILNQWLPRLGGGGGTSATADRAIEYESITDDAPLPTKTDNEQVSTNDEKPEPAGIDMGLFDRMYDNLSARIPYLASCLSISNSALAGEKMFAVLAMGYLRGSDPIMRPQDDSDGMWGQDEHLCVSEAIRRSMLFGQ